MLRILLNWLVKIKIQLYIDINLKEVHLIKPNILRIMCLDLINIRNLENRSIFIAFILGLLHGKILIFNGLCCCQPQLNFKAEN
jgi:hypothetical protein